MYVICINQRKPQPSTTELEGFSVDFASYTNDSILTYSLPFELDDIEPVKLNSQELVISFSKHIDCNTIDPSDISITAPDGSNYAVNSITDKCDPEKSTKGIYQKSFHLTTDKPFNKPGSYTLSINDNSGITDFCVNQFPGGSKEFEVYTDAGQLYAEIKSQDESSEFCFGREYNFVVEVSGGVPPYSYTWNSSHELSSENGNNSTVKITSLNNPILKVEVTDDVGSISKNEFNGTIKKASADFNIDDIIADPTNTSYVDINIHLQETSNLSSCLPDSLFIFLSMNATLFKPMKASDNVDNFNYEIDWPNRKLNMIAKFDKESINNLSDNSLFFTISGNALLGETKESKIMIDSIKTNGASLFGNHNEGTFWNKTIICLNSLNNMQLCKRFRRRRTGLYLWFWYG